jgi:hypothetical protein
VSQKEYLASGFITVQIKVTCPGNWQGNESMENLHKSISRECLTTLENCIQARRSTIEIIGNPEVTLVTVVRNKT